MQMYSGAGLENFDPEDLKGAIYDVISIIGSLTSILFGFSGKFFHQSRIKMIEKLSKCGWRTKNVGKTFTMY